MRNKGRCKTRKLINLLLTIALVCGISPVQGLAEEDASQARPSELGASSQKHELLWIDDGNAAVEISDNYKVLNITPADNSTQKVRLQLNFTLGGTDSVPANGVTIRIPKHILQDRNGNGAIKNVTLGIPKAPAQGDTNFHYTEEDDYYVVTNYKSLVSADNLTCTLVYQFLPSDIKNDEKFSFQASFEVKDEDGNTILDKTSPELSITVHTDAKLSPLRKSDIGKWDTWQSSWGDKPADGDDYFYVAYYYTCLVNIYGNTQPYTIHFEEDPQNGGELVGWWKEDTYSVGSGLTTATVENGLKTKIQNQALLRGNAEEFQQRTAYSIKTMVGVSSGGQRRYQAVLVRYSNTPAPQVDNEYTNIIKATLTGVDGASDTKNFSSTYKYKELTHQYPGDKYEFTKHQSNLTEQGPLTMLLNGRPFDDSWSLIAKAQLWSLAEGGAKDYTLEVTDEGLSGLAAGEDYVFTSFKPYAFTEYDYEIDIFDGYTKVPSDTYSQYKPIEIYIQGESDIAADHWQLYGTLYKQDAAEYKFRYESAYVSAGVTEIAAKSGVPLPEGTGRIKAVYTGNVYHVDISLYVSTRIKPTDKVKGIAQRHIDAASKWRVTNYGQLRVLDSQRQQTYVKRDSRHVDLTGLEATSLMEKTAMRVPQNDTVHSRMFQDFSVTQVETLKYLYTDYTAEELIADGYLKAQKNGTFYELLPKGSLIDNVAVGTYGQNKNGMTGGTDANFTVDYQYDWRNSGQTMMIVQVTGPADGNTNYSYIENSGNKTLYSGYTLTYTLYYPWENISIYGTQLLNSVAYQSEEGYPLFGGRSDDGYFGSGKKTDSTLFEGLDATNPNNTREKRFMYAEIPITLSPVTSHESGMLKKVMGSDPDQGYENAAQIALGETYTYRLRFISQTGQSSSGVIIYDSLENAGTGGTNNWRGVLERIDISNPLSKGVDVKVYYSVRSNGVDPTDPNEANLSNSDLWALMPLTGLQPNELKQITALAFDLSQKTDGNDYIFQAGEGVEVLLHMRAPSSSSDELIRNMAYLKVTTTPTSGGNSSTAIEPGNTTEIGLSGPGPNPDPDPDPNPNPNPDPNPGPNPNPNPDPNPGPNPNPNPDPGPNPGPDPNPGPGSKPGSGSKPRPGSKPDPGSDPDPIPGPEPKEEEGTPPTNIDENDIPHGLIELDDIPKTGTSDTWSVWFIWVNLISAAGLAAIRLSLKKKRIR